MPTEYNKSHIQGILKKNGKNTTLHNFVLFLWRSHFEKLGLRVSSGFQTLENNKTAWPTVSSSGFKSFLAFGNLMKPSHSFLK